MVDTSLRYFNQVLSVISEFNVSEEECLRAAGLNEPPKSDRVSAEILMHILNFAKTRLDDGQIGIRCALRYPILQYTRPSEFLKLCSNLQQAAELYKNYSPLFHTVGTPSKVISEGGIDRMIWVPNISQDQIEGYRQFIELIMTNLVTSINWLAWKTPNAVQRMNFKHDALLPLKCYEALFDCAVNFGQDEYSLILQDGVKDTPFAMSNPAELSKVRLKFDKALNDLFKKESLANRVELQIRRLVERGGTNKDSIAKALGYNERTLARHLKNEGTCFKDIKNRVLKELAVAKIQQGLPLVEVALSLGYNDQPAFTRAYKKWFGCSPAKHKPFRSPTE